MNEVRLSNRDSGRCRMTDPSSQEPVVIADGESRSVNTDKTVHKVKSDRVHEEGSVGSSTSHSSESSLKRRKDAKQTTLVNRKERRSSSSDSRERRKKQRQRRRRSSSSSNSDCSSSRERKRRHRAVSRSDGEITTTKLTEKREVSRRRSLVRSRSRSSSQDSRTSRRPYDRPERGDRFYEERQPHGRFFERSRRGSPRAGGKWNGEERLNPPPSVCLGIFGMSASTSDEHLRSAFSKHGNIRDIQIIRHPITGVSRGFGFINFYELGDAKNAREALNGRFLLGNELRVDYSISKGPRTANRRLNNR